MAPLNEPAAEFVSCDGFLYRIDNEESRLTAHISPAGISWQLDVSTVDEPSYAEIDDAPN